MVREVVGVSHNNLDRVRELIAARPALVNAAWDWGFGDWETPLGAASHVGRRDIAALLLDAGARPTIFSAAMLGQLAVVRAFVEAAPGIQSTHGPHGITLLSHARAGGEPAAAVVAYLESIGGADTRLPTQPLGDTDRDAIVGEYAYGAAGADRLVVELVRGNPSLVAGRDYRRHLLHLGDLVFHSPGVPRMRFEFMRAGGSVTGLVIRDGDFVVTAARVTG